MNALLADEHPANPTEWCDLIFRAGPRYEFFAGALTVRTDTRWYSTAPPAGDGAPLLVLRRWPGDTAVAFYAIAEGTGDPALPGARLEPPVGPEDGPWRRDGQLRTEAGERPVVWIERRMAEAGPRLGVLAVPGDGGFGTAGIAGLRAEAEAVALRAEVVEAAWTRVVPLPRARALALPEGLAFIPGDATEAETPWQGVRGDGFTLGLPPGVHAARLDGGVPPPEAIPGGRLWLRGRFTDLEGRRAAVGDDRRAGYVAEVRPVPDRWLADRGVAPIAAQGARCVAVEPFPLIADRTPATAGAVSRWREPDFDGEWLVFRLAFADHGMELALPVGEGREVPSLYWIPLTWRGDDQAPAAPPVDPARRFGIGFERLTRAGKQDQPWVEGYLEVPGLRAEVSRGWYPSASLRSSDGFPVVFIEPDGTEVGRLLRLDAAEVIAALGRGGDWVAEEKPTRYRAAAVWRDPSGARVFVGEAGDGFLLRPADKVAEGAETGDLWRLMCESVRLSAR